VDHGKDVALRELRWWRWKRYCLARGRGLPEYGKKQNREGGLILFDMQHRNNYGWKNGNF
jgi:hypothetical protein